MSKTATIGKMHRDGTLHQVLSDGTEKPLPSSPPMREMTEAEVEAAARRDPDAQPLTEKDMARMSRVSRAKTVRRALGLTQEEFATRFQIPIGTLRDWEQGRAEPDQTARAYLKAIAGDPEAVWRALQTPALSHG
jgi:putative transcriptional regulator